MNSEHLNASAMYQIASKYHHKTNNIFDAIIAYQEIIDKFPGSYEAKESKEQLDMIKNARSKLLRSSEWLDICKILKIPPSSSCDQMHIKYGEVKKVWDPTRFVHDTDKFFEAKQISEHLEKAYNCVIETLDKIIDGTNYNHLTKDITPVISKSIDIQKTNQYLHKYYKILGLDESASIEEVTSAYKELTDMWNPTKYEVEEPSMVPIAEEKYNEIDDAYNRINQQLTGVQPRTVFVEDVGQSSRMHSIPTHGGLAALAFIMGFGVLGGIALGSHIRTKKLIANGEYDAALKASSQTYFGAMLIIIGVPILALIIIFGMPH